MSTIDLSLYSRETKVLWAFLLSVSNSVLTPRAEVASSPYQELQKAGLITIKPDGDFFLVEVAPEHAEKKFNGKQKNLVSRLKKKPMRLDEYMDWARDFNIDKPLPFLRELMELFVVQLDRTGNQPVYKLFN